jgi:hypothetical protein
MECRIKQTYPVKIALFCFVLVLLARCNNSIALAQWVEDFGYIGSFQILKGQIRDGLDEPVPQATLTLDELKTGKSYSINADEKGYFENSGLPPGKYRVEVKATGFNIGVYTVRIGRSSSASKKYTVVRLSPGCGSGNSGVAVVSKINQRSFKH